MATSNELELVRRAYYYMLMLPDFSFHFKHVTYMCSFSKFNTGVLNFMLPHAVHAGHFRAVKRLVLAGADIHIYDDLPLRWAVAKGCLKVVYFLCKKGANVNAQNGAPLETACCQKNRFKIVRCLIEHDAVVQTRHLDAAAYVGHLNVVQYLVEHGVNLHDVYSKALWNAAMNGHLHVVDFLVRNGVDISSQEGGGTHVAHAAVLHGHRKFTLYLLSAGVRVHPEDLWWAVYFGRLKLVKLLLAHGLKWRSHLVDMAQRRGHEHILRYINKRHVEDHLTD